jgi:LacI family transcriptional regulator
VRRARLRDVAEAVGCSPSSVSLVVNGHAAGRIKPELREAIERAVRELNYQPNGSARDLKRGQPTTVALLCPDIGNPFFGDLIKGCVSALKDEGYTVDLRVGLEQDDYGLDTVRAAQSGNIAGLLLAAPARAVLESLVPTGPTVLIDSPGDRSHFPSVELDLAGAARALARHLSESGFRRVAYVDVHGHKGTFQIRLETLAEELARHGAELVDTVEARSVEVSSGYDVFVQHRREWSDNGVSAIICADDILAFGAMAAARDEHVRIPRDFALASFNDLPYARLLDPALTSVRFDAFDVGVAAGNVLLEVMNGASPANVVVPTTLQVRASTAGLTAPN